MMAFGSRRALLAVCCGLAMWLGAAPEAALATSVGVPDELKIVSGNVSFEPGTGLPTTGFFPFGSSFDLVAGSYDPVENQQRLTVQDFAFPTAVGFPTLTNFTWEPEEAQPLNAVPGGESVNGTATFDLGVTWDLDTGEWWSDSAVVRVLQTNINTGMVTGTADFAFFFTTEENGLETPLSTTPEIHSALPTQCGANTYAFGRPDGEGLAPGPISGNSPITLVALGCVLTSNGSAPDVGSIDPGLVGDSYELGEDFFASNPPGMNDSFLALNLMASVPEPTTALMLGAGLAALGLRGRRRA